MFLKLYSRPAKKSFKNVRRQICISSENYFKKSPTARLMKGLPKIYTYLFVFENYPLRHLQKKKKKHSPHNKIPHTPPLPDTPAKQKYPTFKFIFPCFLCHYFLICFGICLTGSQCSFALVVLSFESFVTPQIKNIALRNFLSFLGTGDWWPVR